jgi:hypothetical protein
MAGMASTAASTAVTYGRYVLYSLPPGILPGDGAATEHLDLGCWRLEIPKPEG